MSKLFQETPRLKDATSLTVGQRPAAATTPNPGRQSPEGTTIKEAGDFNPCGEKRKQISQKSKTNIHTTPRL